MPTCPECGFNFVNNPIACHNLIAEHVKKGLRTASIKASNTFEKVREYILKLPVGTELKTADIITLFSLQEKTNGDILRKTLDFYVCEGILNKIKFGNGSSGHRYITTGKRNFCKYYQFGKKECLFDWKNDGKKIDFKRGSIKEGE